jgi:hypothetical protein
VNCSLVVEMLRQFHCSTVAKLRSGGVGGMEGGLAMARGAGEVGVVSVRTVTTLSRVLTDGVLSLSIVFFSSQSNDVIYGCLKVPRHSGR